MIGLDTNVLVRYLTQDDPIQSLKATEILERRLTEENPGFVSIVAITAMIALKEGQGSFADAIIAALGAKAGCSCTLTFDHKALRLPGFELP